MHFVSQGSLLMVLWYTKHRLTEVEALDDTVRAALSNEELGFVMMEDLALRYIYFLEVGHFCPKQEIAQP